MGSQQDIDFVLAYDHTVVMIEAKADDSFANSSSEQQFLHKFCRVSHLAYCANKTGLTELRFFLCTLSPDEIPPKLPNDFCWQKNLNNGDGCVPALKMESFHNNEHLCVERCNKKKKSCSSGGFWHTI